MAGAGRQAFDALLRYPSARWSPPPLHAHFRPLPLPPRRTAAVAGGTVDAGEGVGDGGRRRVWLQNKYYPEGHGTADNFWSLDELRLILDRLLGCGAQVIYNHPELAQLGAADANDLGRASRRFQLGDAALLRERYASALRRGAAAAAGARTRRMGGLAVQRVQLRVVSKARCFRRPRAARRISRFTSLACTSSTTGPARAARPAAAGGGGADGGAAAGRGHGAYWQYYTALPGAAGGSIIVNAAGNRTRLVAALDATDARLS